MQHALESRREIAARLSGRFPETSYNMRALIVAVCCDPQTPLAAVHRLNDAIVPATEDQSSNWDVLNTTIGEDAIVRALVELCRTFQTGVVTAYSICTLHDRLRSERQREHNVAPRDEESVQQARRQAYLAYLFEVDDDDEPFTPCVALAP